MFRRSLYVSGAVIITIVIGYFIFRNTLLQWEFNRVKEQTKQNINAELNVADIHFAGFDKISLTGLCFRQQGADTLLQINSGILDLTLSELLIGKLDFDKVELNGVYVNIFNEPERNNISNLKKPGKQNTDTTTHTGYRSRINDIKSKMLRALGAELFIKDIHINYRDTSSIENLYVPGFDYDLHTFSAAIINEQVNDTINLTGAVLKKGKDYQFRLQRSGTSNSYLPLVNRANGFKCKFSSVSGEIKFDDTSDELQVSTNARAEEFCINHWRLAKDDVVVHEAAFKGLLRIGDEYIQMDSTSVFTMNHAEAQVFADYHRSPGPTVAFELHVPESPSDTLFNSLPAGMFTTLKGISCSGTLGYDLIFSIDNRQPDSLVFMSLPKKKDFHLIHYGAENYGRINEPFAHDAYNKDQFVRRIIIGPENPTFTPLQQISPYLQHCVLQSEDPGFMNHRGFIPESFRESIIQNYKEKRFARGGSTISMQLVKNVFLTHNKTVSRKAEEAVIVYLIENLQLVSKERMLEVYLNAIEWGPNIYGIGEASHFYFNKRPSELNLQESMFLAAIIPNPKSFRYQFDKTGHVKNYLEDFFKLLGTRMASHGWLTEADADNLKTDVRLSGPALQFIIPVDTTVVPIEDDLQ